MRNSDLFESSLEVIPQLDVCCGPVPCRTDFIAFLWLAVSCGGLLLRVGATESWLITQYREWPIAIDGKVLNGVTRQVAQETFKVLHLVLLRHDEK